MVAYDRREDSISISTKLVLSISSEHFIISEEDAKILHKNLNSYFSNQIEMDI